MKALILTAALALVAAPLAAQGGMDPDKGVAGGGTLPAGWSSRLDARTANAADLKFVVMGPGLHVTSGPATILWRAADQTDGKFHTEATFTRTKAPTHPEAYGIFVGGRDLAADAQTYVYFLTRGDGKFLISKANGTVESNGKPAVTGVSGGWTTHAAVTQADADGKSTDKLEVMTVGTKLQFKVNGQMVHEMDAAGMDLSGVAGLRINHNLDVHIAGFVVHKLP